MAWEIVAYQDERACQPVNDFARPVRGKLWELRIQSGRNIYRIFYFAHTGRRFVLLHTFQKKTRKTPRKELAIAERRLNDVLARAEEE